MQTTQTAYCGPAPLPADLWSSWNFDPLLIAIFAVVGAGALAMSSVGMREAARSPFGVAAVVLFVAFVSPICALSSALFSARIVHHLLLVAAAAPLLALAMPTRFSKLPLSAAFLAHTLLMWVWHAPIPYDWALASVPVYWLMELSLFLSAFAMWQGIFAARAGPALSALLGSIVQMGMLGALLTFAARPLYEAHATTTLPYGLTPLGDQQLAGLLMWVPAALPYLAVALVTAWRQFGQADPFTSPRVR
ncbi:cytochrome c oxidase assembly protein [Aliihoeflea sp. 40Bstr573]|uniref:cytochrome c oxidase assembly protein n=1 Tax=Aliihoeflea sp. 40Bstr573 TaxID=2696467 RepID=UPI0020943463|nr:cytochrome c oxidase assembly protein [Aliihoeflea sp. 40Bstr573]MCO6387254.1 cytochrome c oxidase assembly protein [Aliihoeflea sp. 40Bstr573]